MSPKIICAGLSALVLNLLLVTASPAESADGENQLTPNQQRRIVQVNQDLPKDLVDQTGDSRRVAELRKHLREQLAEYRQTAKKFGNGTAESRAAAHEIMETQKELHQQFVREEATPAIPTLAAR